MEQKQDKTLAMVCHLLGLTGFIGPLVIWLMKKNESPIVNTHGKESLNFQISIHIYFISAILFSHILPLVELVVLFAVAVMIFNYAMIIQATIKTNKGEDFKYPLSLRLIK